MGTEGYIDPSYLETGALMCLLVGQLRSNVVEFLLIMVTEGYIDPVVCLIEVGSPALHCTALHCTALHCTALHCTALHCTALHCTALHCTALHCTALHCPRKG
ncbi:unnamed protein product [Closterium sp. NIES-54]